MYYFLIFLKDGLDIKLREAEEKAKQVSDGREAAQVDLDEETQKRIAAEEEVKQCLEREKALSAKIANLKVKQTLHIF